MAQHSSFESLGIYKEATLFSDAIWEIICHTSLNKDYKLREQING